MAPASPEDDAATVAFVGRVREAVEGSVGTEVGAAATSWARDVGARLDGCATAEAQARVLVDALCGSEEGREVLAAKSVDVFDALFGVFDREKQRGSNPRMGSAAMGAAGEILGAMGAVCSGREMVTLLSEEINRYRTTDACRLCLQAVGPVVEGLGPSAKAYESALPPAMALARTTLRLPLVAEALTGGVVKRRAEEEVHGGERRRDMDGPKSSHERWGWAAAGDLEEPDEAEELVEHLGVLEDAEALFLRLLAAASNDEDRHLAVEATLGLLMRSSFLASKADRADRAAGTSVPPPSSGAHAMARRLARAVCYTSGISLADLMDADAWGSAAKAGWRPRTPGEPVDRVRPQPSLEAREARRKNPFRGKLLLPEELKRCLGLCACMIFLDGLHAGDAAGDAGGVERANSSAQAAAPWAPDYALTATFPGMMALLRAEEVPWLAERGLRLLQFHRGRCTPEVLAAAFDTSGMREVLSSLCSLLWGVRENGDLVQEVLAEFRCLLDTLKGDWTLALRHLVALMDAQRNAYVKSVLFGLLKDHLYPSPGQRTAAAGSGGGGGGRQPPPADLDATRLPRGGDGETTDESVAEYVRGLVKSHLHADVDLARGVEACVSACNLCRFVCLRDKANGSRVMLPGGAADWEVLRKSHLEPLLDTVNARLRVLRGVDPPPQHPEPWMNEPEEGEDVVPDAMLELRLDALSEGLRSLRDLDLF